MAPKPLQLDLFGRPLARDWVPTLPPSEPASDEEADDWLETRRDMDELAKVGSWRGVGEDTGRGR